VDPIKIIIKIEPAKMRKKVVIAALNVMAVDIIVLKIAFNLFETAIKHPFRFALGSSSNTSKFITRANTKTINHSLSMRAV
jgi:hypothetical protein